MLVVLGLASLALDLAQRNKASHTSLLRLAPFARGGVYGAMLVGLVVFSGQTPVPFIYFQF